MIDFFVHVKYPVENPITKDELCKATNHGFLENRKQESSTSTILGYMDYKSFNIYKSEQEDPPQKMKGAQVALDPGIYFVFIFCVEGSYG